MNKRIKELALKSVQHLDWDPPSEPKEYTFTSDGLDQFAELIVRECLTIVNRKEYSYHEADPLWETVQLIKEHFGVKE